MQLPNWLFDLRGFLSRMTSHKYRARRVNTQVFGPDTSASTYHAPTLHGARYARLKRIGQELYNYRYSPPTSKDRYEIGEEVGEAMLTPPEPSEALTELQTQPTRVVPSPFRTQPLEEQ